MPELILIFLRNDAAGTRDLFILWSDALVIWQLVVFAVGHIDGGGTVLIASIPNSNPRHVDS